MYLLQLCCGVRQTQQCSWSVVLDRSNSGQWSWSVVLDRPSSVAGLWC